LFPQSYTTPNPLPSTLPPPSPSANMSLKDSTTQLHSLPEESETGSMASGASKSKDTVNSGPEGSGVMNATLTDIQEAIEQLGRNDRDGEATSFSFTSTRDGETDRETDRETDIETDREGDDWHKGARHNLAEKARREVERREREAQESFTRLSQPPIQVEVSDESDDDDEYSHQPPSSHISEEEGDDEHEESAPSHLNGLLQATSTTEADEHEVTVPSKQASLLANPYDAEAQTATAKQLNFPAEAIVLPPSMSQDKPLLTPLTPTSPIVLPSPSDYKTSVDSLLAKTSTEPPAPILSTAISNTTSIAPSTVTTIAAEPLVETASSPAISLPSPPPSTAGPVQTAKSFPVTTTPPKTDMSHPSEWSVEEVVEWAKGKGFDQSVCDKFIGWFLFSLGVIFQLTFLVRTRN